jgi:hypothetical protein
MTICFGLRAAKCVAHSSIISPAPMNSTRCSATLSKMRSARRTDAAAIETMLAPIAVVERTSLATAKELWNSLFSVVPSAPDLARDAHGLLHLPEDLRFAEHHRIEPAGDAKGVAHGIPVRMRVEVGFDRMRGDTTVVRQPIDRRLRRVGLAIQFCTVARRQDRRLVHVAATHQIGQRTAQLFGMKRQLLAHLKRRRAVVYAESE